MLNPMTNATMKLSPIEPADADRLRDIGGPLYVVDEHPGYPCRQCLKDADIGDELILVSHDPFHTDSPYRSPSPIFLHRHPCHAPTSNDEVPEQLTRRRLSVRSFDEDEMMIDAAIVPGADLSKTVEIMFGAPESVVIHVHNAERGCWATKIVRG